MFNSAYVVAGSHALYQKMRVYSFIHRAKAPFFSAYWEQSWCLRRELAGWASSGQPRCTGGCRYAAPLYVDITKRVVTRAPDAAEQEQQQDELEEYPKVFIGEVRL